MFKLLAVTLLSTTAAVSQLASTPAPVSTSPPDYSKVSIVTTKISDHLYALDGAGGRIGVLVGPDSILLVDSEFAPLTDKIVAAVHAISNEPIRYLVNTHVHGDHTGGNENLGRQGVLIFSRDELRHRLAHPSASADGTPGVAAPATALPVVTYEGPVTFHLGSEEAHLIPVLRAHTDGDTIVRYSPSDAIQTGDIFRSVGYPNIDRLSGGSLRGLLDGLGQIIALAGPNTKILPWTRADHGSCSGDCAA